MPSEPLVDLVQDGASPVRKAAVEALMRLPVHLVQPHEAVIEKQKLLENIPGVLEACTTPLCNPPFSAHSKPGMGFGGTACLAGPGQGDVHAPAGGRGAGDLFTAPRWRPVGRGWCCWVFRGV